MSDTPTPKPGQDDELPVEEHPAASADRTPANSPDVDAVTPGAGTLTATTSAGSAPSTDTPGRGAHLQSRRAPVPPEPDEEDIPVTPRLATAADSAPTAALPALSDPLADDPRLDDPLGTGPHAVSTPDSTGPVRRTSYRTDLEGAPTATAAPFAATPPPAPRYDLELPGTGPADDQVPPGDATVATPEPALPPFPVAAASRPVDTEPERREPNHGGVGRLLLGMLLGLVVGAVGIWLVLFGQSRILGVQAPGWDASYDPLGVVLVTVGVLLLAALLALGAWSSAAPFTAGLLSTVIGVVYLYVPATTHADTVSWIATDRTLGSVERTVVAATSGTLFVVGALLLAAGITFTVLNRRRFARA